MKESFKKLFSVLFSVMTVLPMINFNQKVNATDDITKIVFVGEESCGKTKLINKLIGNSSSTQTEQNTDCRRIALDSQIFEINELHKEDSPEYYENAKIIVVCIPKDFGNSNVEDYFKKITKNIKNKNCRLLVCMTKCDNGKDSVDIFGLKTNVKNAIKEEYCTSDNNSIIKFENKKIIYTSADQDIGVNDLKNKIFGKKLVYNNYSSKISSGVDLDFGSIVCLASLTYLSYEVVRICFFSNKSKIKEQEINIIKNKKKTKSRICKNKVRC